MSSDTVGEREPEAPGVSAQDVTPVASPETTAANDRRRANELDGKEWTRSSISVWSDLRKSPEELRLKHPAMFPTALAERVIRAFTPGPDSLVLDPFAGSGSTLLAARRLGRRSVGFEVAMDYVDLARRRLAAEDAAGPEPDLRTQGAETLETVLIPESVDLSLTSPPYWNILSQRRTADGRDIRDYAGGSRDLSRIEDYAEFVEAIGGVFAAVGRVLRPGGYCVVNVMDIRKKDRFYPLHSDMAAAVARLAADTGLFLDDLIIWDRRSDYNLLRPLGYPAVFRVNKVHEYLVIFRRPASSRVPGP